MAKFDLYESRKYWWWFYYLSLAAAKNSPTEYNILVSLLYDALDYEDSYSILKREELLKKYDGTNGTKQT